MPNSVLTYRRGEIWWVNLNPVKGSETSKTRPCLILQNDVGNQYGSTTVVAPFLRSRSFPFVVNIKATLHNGLDEDRGLNLSQIRAIDSQRLMNRLGVIEDKYWEDIERAILIELGFK